MIHYTLKRSLRARLMRITIKRSGDVIVTAPSLIPTSLIERFVSQKSGWVVKTRNRFLANPPSAINSLLRNRSKKDFIRNKVAARDLITDRVKHFNARYNFPVGRISIRNQKSRWGSCSGKGNLNFNYKILFLPEELRDYIIVHEICHIKELNHSKAFWTLVAQKVPHYRELKKKLRKID